MFKMRHQYGCMISYNYIQLMIHSKYFEFNCMGDQRDIFTKKVTFELALEEYDEV